MRNFVSLTTFIVFYCVNILNSQNIIVKPTISRTPVYFDISAPLITMTGDKHKKPEKEIERNGELRIRKYPFKSTALPKGEDAVWQKRMGTKLIIRSRDLDKNFAGQAVYSLPSDCNGSIGPNHYMQTVNAQYAIYDRDGNMVAGPNQMNTLFEGVAGSDNNDGDPIVLYDQQADRWLAAEFSGVNSNPDYMMIAISETNDPTGSWYRWSWETNGFPDYMKFGVWQDGYYMGVNANGNNEDDIYVFERDKMIAGESDPKMVAFDNPNRPNSGFHAVLPMDNDGDFAPAGTPGQFITINDDAWGNGGDELWIFELHVDWNNTSNSTFQRTQTIPVSAFDSDFGSNLKNISQKGTSQKVDAIPQVLMNRAQYRNFGDHQTVVCTHTVDVDDSDHAGLRWYELENTGDGWSIRQQGTYAPDSDSRWMASIAMNGNKDIAIGYNVSSSNLHPGIRYTGQSAEENANASGFFDIVETSLKDGLVSQTNSDRWGDYSNMSIDPNDDNAFWYTAEYNAEEDRKGTRIASFSFAPPPLSADFVADNTNPCVDETVSFTDKSTGNPSSWQWSFSPSTITYVNGTGAGSQNPEVKFNSSDSYDVTLTVSDGNDTKSETKYDYINSDNIIADFTASTTTISEGESVTFTDQSKCNPATWEWTFENGDPESFSGQNPPDIYYYTSGTFDVILTVTNANNDEDTEMKSSYITVNSPDIIMSDGQKTTCSSNFYDSGNKNNDYDDGEDYTLTVSPADNNKTLQLDFTAFNVQSSSGCDKDYLEIYDGANTDAPLIGKYCGTDLPETVKAGTNGGKLTFHFVSDSPFFSSSTEAGWESKFSCIESSLAMNILSFTAEQMDEVNSLNWSTSDEKMLEKFVIDRSFDGIHFRKLKTQKPHNGLLGINRYNVIDNNPYSLTYYRIRAIDNDGLVTTTKTLSVTRKNNSGFELTSISPNPAKDFISVEYTINRNEKTSLYIYTLSGKLMKMRKLSSWNGTNRFNINLKMMPPGEYILQLVGSKSTEVRKFIISNRS